MIKMKKRILQCALLSMAILAAGKALSSDIVNVYKSATCGCCSKWISHLQEQGFETSYSNESNMSAIKDALGVPKSHRSCHTGVVIYTEGKYIFEGHIPAKIIERFLSKPPIQALGLTVPGMPIGSPGMEVGDRKDYYEVYLMLEDGTIELYDTVNEQH